MQTKYTRKLEKDFRPMYFEDQGIFFYDFMKDKKLTDDPQVNETLQKELEKAGKFHYSLVNIEIQKVPKNPQLHKKIYKGMLGWYKVYLYCFIILFLLGFLSLIRIF